MADYVDDDNLWKEDLFATLGVSVDVQDGELKKAYLKLAKKYHPDKFVEENEEKLEAQRLFSKITVAYDTLSDPKKKHHYLELRRLLASHLPDGQTSTTPVAETTPEVKTPQSSAPNPSQPTQAKVESQPEKESITTDKVKEDQARALYNLGLESIKKKKVDQAIDYFKQAISTKENIAEFHSQLGLAYQQKNWTGMAQSEFKLALKYNPVDKIAKTNMGSAGKDNKSSGEKKGGFFSNLFNFGKKK